MKVEQSYLDDHQLQVTVETDQDSFKKEKHKVARELSKDKKIPGYRPGKAPYQLIVNHFGEGAIVDRALENYLDQIYPQVLEEVDGEPYGPGQLKEIESLEPPIFKFVVPLQPEVEIGEYKDIRIPYEESDVDEQEIDKVIERMLAQQATVEEVDQPAEVGSLADTEITGRPVGAEPDDEEAQIMTNQPLPVMVKAEDEDDSKEWPFPGFSRQLLGVSPGDKLELNYEFDDDESVDEDLRGKEILFEVQVEGIRQRVLPELDEEFVQSVSDAEGVEDFRDQIRQELSQQAKQEGENAYFNQIFEEIFEVSSLKYPPQMLENEIDGEIEQIQQRLQSQGMELEMYLEMQDMDREELREEIRPEAEKRIKRGLLLGSIAEEEGLEIDPDDVTARYQDIIADHFGEEDSLQKDQFMNSRESMNLLNQISSQMISQYTLDYLKALAMGEDVSKFLEREDEKDDELIDEGGEESGPVEEMLEEEEPVAQEEETSQQEDDSENENGG